MISTTTVTATIVSWWNEFFHSRTSSSSSSSSGVSSFVLCGRLRIAYAILFLFDKYILYLDFDHFYLTSIMPCVQYYDESTRQGHPIRFNYSLMCSIAGLFNNDSTQISYVYYTFFYIGILNAILLLLGILPKLQLVLLHLHLLCFQHHSNQLLDGEDIMFLIWNFLFLFIPLHYVSIYDNFRHLFYYTGNTSDPKRKNTETGGTTTEDVVVVVETSWPMWPFRLWQIEICCIYLGAGYIKLSTDIWYSGNALYRIIHTNDFFGGPITPDFIFNRRGPLHILTWLSLVVECSCIILIWPISTRKSMLIAITILHLGIETAMNMHCFEWLTMIGWLFFLVERQQDIVVQENNCKATSPNTAGVNDSIDTKGSDEGLKTSNKSVVKRRHLLRRRLIDLFLLVIIPSFIFDTMPFSELTRFIPSLSMNGKLSRISPLLQRFKSALFTIDRFRTNVARPYYYEPFLHPIGLYQGVWDLFTGTQDHNYRVEAIIHYRNDTIHSHISPDWLDMSWYVKKRWQRHMTFYENFMDTACFDCYARHYAKQYGPKDTIRSVMLMLRSDQPPVEPPGNIFDMEYFFKPAREALVSRTPKEIFVLNYCDDVEDLCEHYMEKGYCTTGSDVSDTMLIQMTERCRLSCQLCDIDADELEVGTRVSVFDTSEEQYVDGTIVDMKRLHTVTQYLIRFDEYENKPKWTTSIALRRLGVRLLTNDDMKGNEIGSLPDDISERQGSAIVVEARRDEL